MLLAFIDETSDAKFKDYLGVCVATINARSYPLLKKKAQKVLLGVSWNPEMEFKGSMIFSASKGCTDVEVVHRIEAAHRLLELNVASENSRLRFSYGRMSSKDHRVNYLKAVPFLLQKALPKPPKRAGKNLIAVICDERSDVSVVDLHTVIEPTVRSRGYVMLESVVQVRSSFDSIGLMFADLVGYLLGRVQNIANDAELFEGLSPEQLENNGKIRKLKSSSTLINNIKALDLYKHASIDDSKTQIAVTPDHGHLMREVESGELRVEC